MEDGQSAKAVATKLGTTSHTAKRWAERWNEEPLLDSILDTPRSGRPQKTSFDQNVDIALTSLEEPFATPRGIKRKLNITEVCTRTIARRLDQAGIPAHLARHKRHLPEEQIAARLAFAHKHKDWSADKWATVLFADEKYFLGEGHPGRVWVRIPKGADSMDPQYTAHKVQHPKSLPAWACFSAKGVGFMEYSYESLDSSTLARIFREYLVPTAQGSEWARASGCFCRTM
jgi:hypothetical protein